MGAAAAVPVRVPGLHDSLARSRGTYHRPHVDNAKGSGRCHTRAAASRASHGHPAGMRMARSSRVELWHPTCVWDQPVAPECSSAFTISMDELHLVSGFRLVEGRVRLRPPNKELDFNVEDDKATLRYEPPNKSSVALVALSVLQEGEGAEGRPIS
jgi:hypothetical protein